MLNHSDDSQDLEKIEMTNSVSEKGEVRVESTESTLDHEEIVGVVEVGSDKVVMSVHEGEEGGSEEKLPDKSVEIIRREKKAPSIKDYESMEMEALVLELEKLVGYDKIHLAKQRVASIKKIFETKFAALLAQKKESFLKAGGASIDFYYESPIKLTYNKLMKIYKSKIKKYHLDLESLLKENLNKQIEVIEELKLIIERADSETMYKEFKVLKERWKLIGPVPRTKHNTTWRNYQHHVERFYDLLRLNKGFRELNFKRNLEEKLKIVERAEELCELKDVSKAFKELQKLHKLWKEDIGQISREFRKEIWHKFSVATKIIHDKRNQILNQQKSEYEENSQLKIALIAELENFDTSNNNTHTDWQKSIKEFEGKRAQFFSIGKVPRNKHPKIWEQLKVATKKFNHAKNLFYKRLQGVQQENLEKKLALISIAESLKDSDDFSTSTPKVKQIQADWKKIGHVSKKVSDKIWKQFKGACDYYFDRLKESSETGSSAQVEALATKKEFLSQIKGVLGNSELTLEEVKAYIKTWNDIGPVPNKAKSIEKEFNKLIEQLFEQFSVKGDDLVLLKYKMSMNALVSNQQLKKINGELQFVRKKIDEFSKEIQQLENNLGFVTNASDTNPLVKNVQNLIDKKGKELKFWKLKLDYLRTVI